jgi:hypothetical protein
MNIIKLLKSIFFQDNNKNVKTNEVFKISGIPKYTFIEREEIDNKIDEVLVSRNKVISFIGYSKSGKTVYRDKYFGSDYTKIVFRCNEGKSIGELYTLIASELNLGQIISSTGSTSKKSSHQNSVTAGKKDVGAVAMSDTNESQYSFAMTKEHSKVKIDVDFLCNRISKDLRKNLVIFLEDYHLIDSEFNRIFSQDLKHFTDEDILFVIIGIPSAPGRTLKHNPDLSGRTSYVNFDFLSKEEIYSLIEKGENLLNVEFSLEIKEKISEYSLKNAFLVQYICQEILTNNRIYETQPKQVKLNDYRVVENACKNIAIKLNSDYESAYLAIIGGIRKQQSNKAYNQYEEILKYVKYSDIQILERGASYTEISQWSWSQMQPEYIQELIKKGKYQNEATFKGSLTQQLSQAVDGISAALEKNKAKSIILAVDKKIFVMDIVFKFYLDWKKK